MPCKIRILIVDDHSMVRMGLAGFLSMEPDMQVVAEAEDMEQALAAFGKHRPDVTLMDVRMPGGSGLDAIARILARDPDARIVVLSSYDLEEPMIAAHKAGAVGYLLKTIKGPELATAIRTVHAGGFCFPQALQDHLAARAGAKSLTPREIETLDLMRRGLSNREIGKILKITERTAKFHISSIFAKLGCADRTEAVSAAFDRGLLQAD